MDYLTLVDAIKDHADLDDETLIEAGTYGADAGWPGFTYTTDAAEFYHKNTELVDELLQEGADAFGYDSVLEFMATFNRKDMGDTDLQLDNLKAWYALEEAGRWLAGRQEEE